HTGDWIAACRQTHSCGSQWCCIKFSSELYVGLRCQRKSSSCLIPKERLIIHVWGRNLFLRWSTRAIRVGGDGPGLSGVGPSGSRLPRSPTHGTGPWTPEDPPEHQ